MAESPRWHAEKASTLLCSAAGDVVMPGLSDTSTAHALTALALAATEPGGLIPGPLEREPAQPPVVWLVKPGRPGAIALRTRVWDQENNVVTVEEMA
jgi:hypothetical protein